MDKEYRKMLVEQLCKYRLDNKYTIKMVADKLNLPLFTVADWLSKERCPSEISASILEKFLKENGYIN